ncbi:Mitochondrial transcription termination factor family protein [Euphorbia peplus]|nr:Mitochondrial transcription termination factor family protein [Euphorbia peplus]
MLPWISIFRSLKASHHQHLHKFPNFPPLYLASFSTSTPNISILNRHHFSLESASKVSSLSSTNYLRNPQNADSILSFLKDNGFAKNHLETLIQKAPWILSANLETTLKPKLEIFQDLGFHSTDLADIVSISPWLLWSSANRLQLSVSRLKNVLGPNADVSSFLKYSGAGRCLARRDLDKTLIPNIEYLKSCEICELQIARYIYRAPTTFFIQPDKLKDFVKRVDEMGVDRQSKMFLCAVRAVSSMSRKNWELKLKLFRELGFSEQEILDAFRVAPQGFSVSERKIKEVIQLLLTVVDISYIARYLSLLTYSVEKRLKPRLRVLKILESNNLLKKRPGLAGFVSITNAKFINKYVIPYSDEVGDLRSAFQGSEPTDSVLQTRAET